MFLSLWSGKFPFKQTSNGSVLGGTLGKCLREGGSEVPPCCPSGMASSLRAEDPGFESRLCRDFFGLESYQ